MDISFFLLKWPFCDVNMHWEFLHCQLFSLPLFQCRIKKRSIATYDCFFAKLSPCRISPRRLYRYYFVTALRFACTVLLKFSPFEAVE